MNFTIRHINRIKMPTHLILIVEDDLQIQAALMSHMSFLFDRQGHVSVSCVSSALEAAGAIESRPPDLILLDHDLQYGNGVELIFFLKEKGLAMPVMTFSGIAENNRRMMEAGATYNSDKNSVLSGVHDAYIKTQVAV